LEETSIPPAGVEEPSKYRAEDIILNWNHWEEMQRRGDHGLVFHHALPKDVRAHGSRGKPKGRGRGKKYVEIDNDEEEDDDEEDEEDEDGDEEDEEDEDERRRADEKMRQKEKGKGKAHVGEDDSESRSSTSGQEDRWHDELRKKVKRKNQAGGTSGQSTSQPRYRQSKSRETHSDDSMEVDRDLEWNMDLDEEDTASDAGPPKPRNLVGYESDISSAAPTPLRPLPHLPDPNRYMPARPSPLHSNTPVTGDWFSKPYIRGNAKQAPAKPTSLVLSGPVRSAHALSSTDGPALQEPPANKPTTASSVTHEPTLIQASQPTAALSASAEPISLHASQPTGLNLAVVPLAAAQRTSQPIEDDSAAGSSSRATGPKDSTFATSMTPASTSTTPAGHSSDIRFMLNYLQGLSSEAEYQKLYAALHKVSTPPVHSLIILFHVHESRNPFPMLMVSQNGQPGSGINAMCPGKFTLKEVSLTRLRKLTKLQRRVATSLEVLC